MRIVYTDDDDEIVVDGVIGDDGQESVNQFSSLICVLRVDTSGQDADADKLDLLLLSLLSFCDIWKESMHVNG